MDLIRYRSKWVSFIYLFIFARSLQFHANSISTVVRASGPSIFDSSSLLLFKAKCAHKLSRWVRWCGNWLKPIVETSVFFFFLIVCNGIDNTFQRATIKIFEFQVRPRLVTFSTCDIIWCIKKNQNFRHILFLFMWKTLVRIIVQYDNMTIWDRPVLVCALFGIILSRPFNNTK